uniref:RNase H type-1 domain-containing protein n=1 Tax=Cannabis sativa TaxID=3483 RepID=A0A803NGS4_CANSA
MTTNQGISTGKLPVIISNQFEGVNIGKSNIQGINDVADPIHVGTNMETSEASPLLVIDTKRRRTNEVGSNGPDGVGLQNSDNMDILVCDDDTEEGSKNGLLVDLVIQKRPNLVFLCETLCRKNLVEKLRVAIGFEGMVASDARGHSGGVALLWRFSDEVVLLGYSLNYIDLKITTAREAPWRLTLIEVHLDRVLAAHDWTQRFITTQLFNLEVTISDHCPILLRTAAINLYHSVAQFHFENAWLREPLCRQYKRSVAALGEVYTQREVFWRQRSKQLWLREGDQNSKFFHAKATARKKNNSINSLLNNSGVWVDWEGGLSDVIVDYFSDIFTSTSSNFDTVSRAAINGYKLRKGDGLLIWNRTFGVLYGKPKFLLREEELIFHVLVGCNFAQSCWNLSSVPTSAIMGTEFGEWIEQILNNCQPVVFEEALMVAWAIWKARNGLLWNKNATRAAEVFPLPGVVNNTSNNYINWTAPAAGFLKVNVDGAVFSASDSFGVGGLARDSNGQFIEAFCMHKAGCFQPSLVEAIGVKEALSWIKNKGWEHVTLETDSLVVVQALQIKRFANNVVHCLTRGASYWSDCIFVGSNVPDAINNAVMADLAVLS